MKIVEHLQAGPMEISNIEHVTGRRRTAVYDALKQLKERFQRNFIHRAYVAARRLRQAKCGECTVLGLESIRQLNALDERVCFPLARASR